MKEFDLTTSAGIKTADTQLKALGWVFFPTAMLAKALIDWFGSTTDVTSEKQAEAAVRIIKSGREHGAKRIKMTVDKDVGVMLKSKIKGADISGGIGTHGKMELEIEYK